MDHHHVQLIIGSVSRSRMAKSLTGNAKKRQAELDGIRLVALDLSATLGADDSTFDRQAFLTACGF